MSLHFGPSRVHHRHNAVVGPIGGAILDLEDDPVVGANMLDSFIIDRIRRRDEDSRDTRVPLSIEPPRDDVQPPRDRYPEDYDVEQERGVAIIDFSI